MSHFNTWLFSAKSGLCGDSFYNTYNYNTANDNFMTFTLTTNPSTQIGTFDAIITNFHEQSGEILMFGRQSSRPSLMMIFLFLCRYPLSVWFRSRCSMPGWLVEMWKWQMCGSQFKMQHIWQLWRQHWWNLRKMQTNKWVIPYYKINILIK